jgi:hypothetical protein
MIAGKTYGLAVIERSVATYATGLHSLRRSVWSLLGERTPSHTTLHGWTEGLGAYALGRESGELPGGVPFSAVARETQDRIGEIEKPLRSEPLVDPRRYRSAARRERLSSLSRVVKVAAAVAAVARCEGDTPISPLVCWRQLLVTYGLMSPFSFRTGRKNPRIELADQGTRDPGGKIAFGGNRCEVHARSPPGDTNRSPPSSTQP